MTKISGTLWLKLRQKTEQQATRKMTRKTIYFIYIPKRVLLGLFVWDDPLKTNIRIVKFHPAEGIYSIAYIDQPYIDS